MTSYKRKPSAARYDARRRRKGRVPRRIEEEFRFLINNIIPATEEGMEWIWEETKKVLQKYPDLKRKVDKWLKEDMEAEREEARRIVREWEEARRRMHKWRRKS